LTDLADTFDVVLNTVSATVDLDAHLGLLKLDRTLVDVGVPGEPLVMAIGS
jgi:uncharacterized zinc-type alcohol dehydrogenase-like protein